MNAIDIENSINPLPSATLRILVLEESPEDSEVILQELENAGMTIDPTVVADRAEYEAAVKAGGFAAVLSSNHLAGWTGLEALQSLRRTGRDTPFLLVTNALEEKAAAEFVKLGFDDYVLKNRIDRLPAALKRALEEKHLRDANARIVFALQESEARNRDLVENSIQGIFRNALDGSFLSANPALLQILACESLGDLQSLNLSTDVFRYPEHFVKLLAACRAHAVVQSAESEWRRKDGGLVAVRLHFRYL